VPRGSKHLLSTGQICLRLYFFNRLTEKSAIKFSVQKTALTFGIKNIRKHLEGCTRKLYCYIDCKIFGMVTVKKPATRTSLSVACLDLETDHE
jgi:hypothetical protein